MLIQLRESLPRKKPRNIMNHNFFKKWISFLSLFGSFGTLFCCALPVLFVSLGLGAVFASITSAVPQIYFITEHKLYLFLLTGGLLASSYFLLKHQKIMECPVEETKHSACQTGKSWSQKIFWISVALYSLGLLFTYILPFLLSFF